MLEKDEKLALWVQQFSMGETCQDKVIQQLGISSKLIILPPQITVFSCESNCDNYLLVTKGRVKVSIRAVNGSELILYRVEAGESCALTTTCLMAKKPYPADAITETETTAFLISKQQFDKALIASDVFRQHVFNHLSQRFTGIISRIESVKFCDLSVRLSAELLMNASGKQRIQLTHQAIANEICASRESVSRSLKVFENKGLIKLGRGYITILDSVGLQQLREK